MYEYAHENGFELISRGIKIDFLGFIKNLARRLPPL
jgi:hypothetical protein